MADERNNAVEIDALQVSIESRSVKNAADNLKQLSSGLTELKKAVSGLNLTKAISGFSDLAAASSKISVANVENISLLAMALSDLSKVGKVTAAIPKGLTNQINNLNQVTQSIPESSIKRLSGLASALNTLGSAKMPKISASVGNQIHNIGTALKTLDDKSYAKIPNLVNALQPLTTLGKSQLTTFINQLSKLPQLASEFDNVNMDKFAASIERLASAMRPLADEMDKVSRGFSALPSKMQSIIRTSAKIDTAVKTNKKSWADLFATTNTGYSRLNSLISTGAVLVALHKVKDVLTNSVKESNDYIENLNLFNVAMGEYATEAREYAEQVGEAAGIDPSQWMRNQAVIMDMTKSFGVSADAAYTMSKALTQLTYDFSSLYNLDIEESATKIQSAIAGEIEPIRRLGKDLSAAKLQLVATNLGILDNVDAMNQADKAMLRTIALLRQSTSAQGDLSRTLEQPANQIRILTAQITLLSRSLGNLFLPIIQKLLPYAIAATKVLRSIIDEFANLAGFELPEFDFSESSSTVTDLGNAFETTYESAKKLSLLSFDQITILGDSSSSLDGSGGGVSDNTNKLIEELERLAKIEDELFNKNLLERTDELTQQFTDWLTKGEGIKAWVQDIKDWFGNIVDFATQIAEQLGLWKIPQAIENLLEKFGIEVDLVDFDFSNAVSGETTGGANLGLLLAGAIGLALGIGTLSRPTASGNLLRFGLGAIFALGACNLLYDDTTIEGDTSQENGLYTSFKTALELGLLGAALTTMGKGLQFGVGTGFAITGASLIWSGINQQPTSPSETFEKVLKMGIGSLLGGVGLSFMKGGLKGVLNYGLPLSLSILGVAIAADAAYNMAEANTGSEKMSALLQTSLGTMLGATGLGATILKSLGVATIPALGWGLAFAVPIGLALTVAMYPEEIKDVSEYLIAESGHKITFPVDGEIDTERIAKDTAYTESLMTPNVLKEFKTTMQNIADDIDEHKSVIDEFAEQYGKIPTIAEQTMLEYEKMLEEWTQKDIQHFDNVFEQAEYNYNNFATTAQTTSDELLETFIETTKDGLKKRGSYIIDGFNDALKDAKPELKQGITDYFSTPIKSAFEEDMEIHSPSKVFMRYGEDVSKGLSAGFEENVDYLEDDVSAYMVEPIKSAFTTGMDDVSELSMEYGAKIITSHINGINSEKSSVLDSYNGMFDSITSDFDDFSSDMLDKAQSYVDSLSDILQTNSTSKTPLVTWGTKVGSIRTPAYATGGMPEDGLFFANSSELVGRFSNGRTAVANNDMIIAGIEQGVYKAVTRALQSNSGGSRNIVLDGQVVGKVVDNAIQTERRRSGKLTVTVG